MTEKSEFIEIHPMRGHSRGDWYGTLDDIVDSEEEAEYWALFGVTHRGNKHCLGEFPTKSAAISAKQGISRIPGRARKARASERKIVQIEVAYNRQETTMIELFVLCDDGTVWRRGIGIGRGSVLEDERWEQISLEGVSGDQVRFASGFGVTADRSRKKT